MRIRISIGTLLPFWVIAAAYCFELYMRYS